MTAGAVRTARGRRRCPGVWGRRAHAALAPTGGVGEDPSPYVANSAHDLDRKLAAAPLDRRAHALGPVRVHPQRIRRELGPAAVHPAGVVGHVDAPPLPVDDLGPVAAVVQRRRHRRQHRILGQRTGLLADQGHRQTLHPPRVRDSDRDEHGAGRRDARDQASAGRWRPRGPRAPRARAPASAGRAERLRHEHVWASRNSAGPPNVRIVKPSVASSPGWAIASSSPTAIADQGEHDQRQRPACPASRARRRRRRARPPRRRSPRRARSSTTTARPLPRTRWPARAGARARTARR